MKVPYTTHIGANATYADIDPKLKAQALSTLQRGVNAFLELSNVNPDYRDLLFGAYPVYGRHTAAGPGKYNSLASFAGGLLNQHLYNPKKDISVKMLPGITLACRLFREMLGPTYLEFDFELVRNSGKPPSDDGDLFEYSKFLT